MSTTTIEDQLAEVRRRIDRLQAFAQTAPSRRAADPAPPRRAAPGGGIRPGRGPRGPDEVEEKLGQLKTRLAVAENSVVADVSDEWTTFAAAVEDELRSWDTYLERLQATAAAKAGNARERAEAAIADVRSRRIAVYDRLAQARDGRQRRLARAEGPRQRGSRRARAEGRRAVGEDPSEESTCRIDPALVTALVAMCAGALMVQAGVAKRQPPGARAGEARSKAARRCDAQVVSSVCRSDARPHPALVREADGARRDREPDRGPDHRVRGSMAFVYIHIVWFGCWIVSASRGPVRIADDDRLARGDLPLDLVMISQNRADAKRQ